MILIASTILFAIILGAVNSAFSYFLDYCFWEGSIFGSYLPWLAKWNLKYFAPERLKFLDAGKDSPEYENELIKAASDKFFFKILGGCMICTNIWLGALTFTALWYATGVQYVYIMPYLLFSSYTLRKMS